MKPAAALYHRVSTLDQNVTLAREELRRAAKMRGLRVALDVEEKGSGARNDRPGLQRVLEAARRGKVSTVLVWKLDRFGRSMLDVLTNVKTLRDCGVTFVCTSQGISVGTHADPAGTLMLHVIAACAEFERELIRERTHLGLARFRRRGGKLGRPSKLPPELPREVARLRARNMSWSVIAKHVGRPQSTVRRAFALSSKIARSARARRDFIVSDYVSGR